MEEDFVDTSYRTSLELNQKQQLSQSQIQSLNILALDNGELSEFLQNEYIENPILDYSPPSSSYTVSESQNFDIPAENTEEVRIPSRSRGFQRQEPNISRRISSSHTRRTSGISG